MKKCIRTLSVLMLAMILLLALFSCGECKHKDTKRVKENEVSASCTKTGSYDEVVYCTECNAEISRTTKSVPKLAHSEVSHSAKAPTCTEIGWDAYVTCENCEYTTYSEIAKAEHSEVSHSAKAPTCTAVGWNAYVTCENCEYSTYEEISETGHSYKNRTCTECGEKQLSKGLSFVSNGNGTCYVSGIGTCKDKDIVIPEISPAGDRVTAIGLYAFSRCDSLTSVVIPSGVTLINQSAFYSCYSLTSIVIPDSVTSIGSWVFLDCDSLTSITVDEDNTVYKSIDGDLYTKDGKTLIQYANGKTDARFAIPDTVTSICSQAFYNCRSLTSVVISDSVTIIGDLAFYNCTSLTSITVDEDNEVYKSIDGNLYTKDGKTLIQYANGKTEASFAIPINVRSIGYSAFYGCDSITSVIIPDTVTSIGYYAFRSCENLLSVTIPDTVTSIGKYAFEDCDSLTSVVIGNSVTSIGSDAFYGCDSLYVVYNYSNLVFEIGSANYGNIAYNAKMIVNKETTTYRNNGYEYILTEDGFLFDYDGTTYRLRAYCGGEDAVTLPESINGNSYEIYQMRGVVNVIIPDSVTEIGVDAFYGCDSLRSIAIPNSVTAIGADAFYNCYSLTSIVIPTGVTVIRARTFYSCYNLTSIVIPDSVTTIGNYAFGGCGSLTSITIPDSATSIGSYAFALCSSLESVEFGDESQLESIDDYAFAYCDSLTSIVIPDSVTAIGDAAFYDCDGITDVYYTGSEAQWAAISIGSYNDLLTNATIHYNYIIEE